MERLRATQPVTGGLEGPPKDLIKQRKRGRFFEHQMLDIKMHLTIMIIGQLDLDRMTIGNAIYCTNAGTVFAASQW
jgi:hypothetical protein